MSSLNVEEFRFVQRTDPYDDSFPHWSRKYEYPLIIQHIDALDVGVKFVHNSSWGFDVEHHQRFKHMLDMKYLCHHTDIVPSTLPRTDIYDVTQEDPNKEEHYNVVVNVSAIEEIPFDHSICVQNLLKQVIPGGYLLCTFDYPGIQLPLILSDDVSVSEEDIDASSRENRITYDATKWGSVPELNVLFLKVHKL